MRRLALKFTTEVARPPQEVFDYLADPRRHAEWSPKPYRVEGLAEGPVRLGSTFASFGYVPRDADHRNEVEVTKFDPPKEIEFTAMDRGEPFVNRYTLTPQGSGTRVDRVMDMPRPDGLMGAVLPLFAAGFIKPAVGKGMTMLKRRLEEDGGSV
jgi:uncharacterized protein YndB with AHSA1/START domain